MADTKKYRIESIKSITLVTDKVRIIQRNVPSRIEVSRYEFEDFCDKNKQYINESYHNTTMDSYVVKDKYGNIIASVYYYMEEEYFISPELLQMGIEQKKLIKNEFEKIGENRSIINNVKPCSFE